MNTETERELNALKKRAAMCTILTIAFFVLTILVGAATHGPVTVVCVAGIVICGIAASRTSKKYAAYYKEHVVSGMTLDDCDFLENVTFEPDRGISEEEVYALRIISGDTYSSNDLITATYKGVGFRQSDVYIGDITTDSDGDRHETTVFQGRWLVFDFNKSFDWNLQVISKGFTSAQRRGGILSFRQQRTERVKLENEEFNKRFRVFAEDEHEAFYILTPHVMEALLGLRESLNAPIMLFFTGGILHVAVYNNQDAFEGKLFGKLNMEEEKQKVLADIRLITDFVDELALERDIYKY